MKQEKFPNTGPLVLLIIDGWGVGPDQDDNLIFTSKTEVADELISRFPSTVLKINSSKLGENYQLLGNGGGNKSLSAIISEQGLAQIKIAEAEKYAYLSYFFNNQQDSPLAAEERILVPSDLIDSYPDKPDLASSKVISATIKAIKSDKYNLIAASLANLDLLSRLGDQEAIAKAIGLIDSYLKKLTKIILNKKGTLIITACRGGAERPSHKKPSTTVPFIIVNAELEGKIILAQDAGQDLLSSITPQADLSSVLSTILKLMHIKHPLDKQSLI